MEDKALKLLDACLEAYDAYHVSKDVTGDGKKETFCNFSVDHVLARMGYEKMRDGGKPMMANQMIDFLKRKTEDWEKIGMDKAQVLANAGRVVLAGLVDEPHGHVVVVRPGLEDVSGNWGGARVPKVSHVGGTSYIGRGVNYAFKSIPDFWVLKETEDVKIPSRLPLV